MLPLLHSLRHSLYCTHAIAFTACVAQDGPELTDAESGSLVPSIACISDKYLKSQLMGGKELNRQVPVVTNVCFDYFDNKLKNTSGRASNPVYRAASVRFNERLKVQID